MALNKKKEKASPLPQEFVIEQLIEDTDGILRPVRPEDLYIDNHPGVRAAFRMIYEWQTARNLESKRERISKDTISEADRELKPL